MGLVIEDMPELGVVRVSRWIFNCYLIRTDGGAIVVDPGLPHVADDLAALVDDVEGGLLAIVATHGHSDHVAGAAKLAERYRAPIYLPAVTLTYLDGVRPRIPRPIPAARIWPAMVGQPFDRVGAMGALSGWRRAGYVTSTGMRWSGPPPDGALTDEQPVPGASGWSVVSTPGHSDDSISLWNDATGTLLSGDAVLSVRGRVWHTPGVVDTASAGSTRRRLEQLPVRNLLPGHGLPVHSDAEVWARQRNSA